MVIDCHGHLSAPQQLWAYRALLLAHRGWHGPSKVEMTDDEIRAALTVPEIGPTGHLPALDAHGTDLQLISPRPWHLMHSEQPEKLIHWFAEECHNVIARQCALFPGRFRGIASIPQSAGQPIERGLPELERCIRKLDFVGCLLNPDPYEATGPHAPPLSDRYWYPLYEKLCELDIPAHVHATTSRSNKWGYSVHMINEESIAVIGLIDSDVFHDFPSLKIVIPHGGGAIPYQLGRFDAGSLRDGRTRFRDRMRHLYYDTVLYSKDALELLIKTVGPERCLFGAECPGVAAVIDPETGHRMDDLKPYIESFDWLTDGQKRMILEDNARRVFRLDA